MDRVVNDFVAVLRRHGLRVSTAETLDALDGLEAVGLGRREEVRDALRATLVKNADDVAAFDRLFDLYFALTPAPVATAAPAGHGHSHHEPPPTRLEVDDDVPSEPGRSDDHGEATPDLRRFFDPQRLRQTPMGGHGEESDRLRLSLFAQQLMLNRRDDALDRVLRRITQHLRVRRARNLMHPGGLAPTSDDAEELPLDVTATELAELIDHLAELEVDDRLLAELEAQADRIAEELPRLIKAMLERRRALDPGTEPAEHRSLVRVQAFREADRRQLEAAIRRLARRLHGARNRRRHRSHSGQISIPHTLRRNLRYEGLPFEPVLRRRREQRPRLVVLCDVSLSTRNLARFWLQLVSQVQDLFSKVRTFVFVADVVEVTDLFRERPFERAVAEVFAGGLLDVDANSDFGRAIGRFNDDHPTAVSRRTSVVILGDARNNGRPPNEAALEAVARSARQLIWMTPEPRWGWPLGGCDLPRYEPICDRVEVVRTVEQLAGVAEDLVQA